jgi:glutamate-ammonia-ligase adenylyltransferase
LDKERPGKSVWDLKEAKGGLFDVEFIAQGLQLVTAPASPEVLRTNTLDAIDSLERAAVIIAEDARVLRVSLDLYQQIMQILRLTVGEVFAPEEASVSLRQLVAGIAGVDSFEAVEQALGERERAVRDVFTKVLGSPAGS